MNVILMTLAIVAGIYGLVMGAVMISSWRDAALFHRKNGTFGVAYDPIRMMKWTLSAVACLVFDCVYAASLMGWIR